MKEDGRHGGASEGSVEEKVLRLPDGNIVVVGEEATAAPELLFKPELVNKNYSGLHELVRAVQPMDVGSILIYQYNCIAYF